MEQKAFDVARFVESALRDRNECVRERQPGRHEFQALKPLVVRQRCDPSWHRNRIGARQQPVASNIESHDAIHPLNAEPHDAAIARD